MCIQASSPFLSHSSKPPFRRSVLRGLATASRQLFGLKDLPEHRTDNMSTRCPRAREGLHVSLEKHQVFE